MKPALILIITLFLVGSSEMLGVRTFSPKFNVFSVQMPHNTHFFNAPRSPSMNKRKIISYTITKSPENLNSKSGVSSNKIERRLMDKAPNIHGDSLVMPSSMPQVDAPRLIIRNFPKPTNVDYLSGRNLNPSPNPSGINYVSSPIANQAMPLRTPIIPDDEKKSSRKLLQSKGRHLRQLKRHQKVVAIRSLNAKPYIDAGPGYMDFGSHGYSPLSYSLFHKDSHQLAPFIPRNNPPSPIRIEIEDHALTIPTQTMFSPSQRQMNEIDTQSLEVQLSNEITTLNSEIQLLTKNFQGFYTKIAEAVEGSEVQQKANNSSGRAFKDKMEEMIETRKRQLEVMKEAIQKNKQNIDMIYKNDSQRKDKTIENIPKQEEAVTKRENHEDLKAEGEPPTNSIL
jgi:hypothetical protein